MSSSSSVAPFASVSKRLKLSKDSVRYLARVAWQLSKTTHVCHCNFCCYVGPFRPYGFPPRMNAYCPNCGTIERHRMIKLWFEQHGAELDKTAVLHVAPERCIEELFRRVARSYVSIDIEAGIGDRVGNIEKLDFADQSFDCIFCSHVLEHVNDRRAFQEMHRVLRPGGVALILVPVVWGWEHTYEDPAIKTPQERAVHFGQADHLRIYGADVRDRIREAGFSLEEFTAEEPDVSLYGLVRGDRIFVSRRPQLH